MSFERVAICHDTLAAGDIIPVDLPDMIRSDLHCAQHSEILVLNYTDCPSFLTLDATRISPKSIQYQVIFVETTYTGDSSYRTNSSRAYST